MLNLDPIVRVNVNVGAATEVSNVYDIGVIMGTTDAISVSDRYAVFANMQEVGAKFSAEDPEYAAAELYFAQMPAPGKVVIARINSGETAAAALTDLASKTNDWYGVYVCNGSASEVEAVDRALTAIGRGVQFYGFVGTPAAAVAPSAIFTTLYNLKSRRSVGIVQAADGHDACAVMGTAMGLAGAHTNDAFALCYKSITGIVPLNATQSEVDDIKAINGNVYVTRGFSRNLFENGATASGLRYDEILYIDMIAAEMQDRCVALIADNATKLPQNDTTSAIILNALTGVLTAYADRGVIASGIWRGADIGGLRTGDLVENGYYLYCDSYDVQTQADREARKAMPINACICLSGSVESIELTVNVQR